MLKSENDVVHSVIVLCILVKQDLQSV